MGATSPVTLQKLAAGHGVAADIPALGQKLPAGQGAQVEDPLAGAYVPALQATDKPVAAHDEPAGHVVHVPFAEY